MTGRMIEVPGVYRRGELPGVAYEDINAVNQSTLKAIGKSPLHYQYGLTHARKQTVPMRLGHLAHTAVLERHLLEQQYAVWTAPPPDTKGKNAGKPKKDNFAGKAFADFSVRAALEGRTVIKQRELDAALKIADAVRANQLARKYLYSGSAELTVVWVDEATGITCKARLDWVSTAVNGAEIMCELKTSGDVSPWVFASQFAKMSFDAQAAFYVDGWKAATGRTLYPKCFAIESAEPHDMIVYDLADVIDVGRDIYREWLGKLDECRRSGKWLGQSPTQEQTLRLPKWRDPEEQNDLSDLGLEYESEAAP